MAAIYWINHIKTTDQNVKHGSSATWCTNCSDANARSPLPTIVHMSARLSAGGHIGGVEKQVAQRPRLEANTQPIRGRRAGGDWPLARVAASGGFTNKEGTAPMTRCRSREPGGADAPAHGAAVPVVPWCRGGA